MLVVRYDPEPRVPSGPGVATPATPARLRANQSWGAVLGDPAVEVQQVDLVRAGGETALRSGQWSSGRPVILEVNSKSQRESRSVTLGT